MKYTQVNFDIDPLNPFRDILIADLSDYAYDSFENTDNGLKAYIPSDKFDEMELRRLHVLQSEEAKITYTVEQLPEKNWNEVWESNFEPISVEDKCLIRAPFHISQPQKYKQEIVIMPQMSFGTGHHQTTFLMIKEMFELDLNGKRVLDMGCGTGVLAILAEKLGSKEIYAVDIDEWSYRNTKENIKLNDCEKIEVDHGVVDLIKGKKFDLILANINRNVLLEDLPEYSNCLDKGGDLFLSGFFEADIEILKNKGESCHLEIIKTQLKDDWAMIHLKKSM